MEAHAMVKRLIFAIKSNRDINAITKPYLFWMEGFFTDPSNKIARCYLYSTEDRGSATGSLVSPANRLVDSYFLSLTPGISSVKIAESPSSKTPDTTNMATEAK